MQSRAKSPRLECSCSWPIEPGYNYDCRVCFERQVDGVTPGEAGLEQLALVFATMIGKP